MAKNNKRYICSFIKKVDDEYKRNVVVVIAPNNIVARAILCEEYKVENRMINPDRHWLNNEAGIKTIRLSDTNTYVDDEGIISHDPRT